MTNEERATIADELVAYAEGVEENLRDDLGEQDFPVVDDYLADSDRIRSGETPVHAHTWEVLDEIAETSEDDFRSALASLRLLPR